MNVGDERTRSLWMDVAVAPNAPALDRNESADTVVIGSGITGMSTAYELSGNGHRVIVVDRGKIGCGMTVRTTAHLSANSDDYFKTLKKTRGLQTAKNFHQSHATAIDRIESIVQSEAIDCDFRRVDGFLFLAPGTQPSELDEERDVTRQVGMPVESTTGVPFKGEEKTKCLRYPRQATFHPTKYLRGLARLIEKRGGRFFSDTAVTGVEEKADGVIVTTEKGHQIRATHVVVATNSPINDLVAIHSKQAPYRTYAMAFSMPSGTLPDALYWDTMDPYHYVRVQPGDGFDYLIVGGADHKSGEADDGEVRFEALEAWIRARVPKLGKETHRWSGQILDPVDYSAFSGRNPGNRNLYIHTGDSGQGMTHGVAGSLLISSMILGRSVAWADIYAPERKTVTTLANYVSENLTVAVNFAEYVAPGEVSSVEEIEPGQGAILRDGLQKIAAYRDKNGKLSTRSAVCTHLGCHIHWNSLEQCWDCPCHGSQFAPDGTVLNAPAISPLAEVQLAEQRKKERTN